MLKSLLEIFGLKARSSWDLVEVCIELNEDTHCHLIDSTKVTSPLL